MFYVSEIYTTAPESFRTELHEKIYKVFTELGISFERVDSDPGITMEDCLFIDAGIGGKTVKTLFLCNRQQTVFYLFVTAGGKPFKTKDFSHALGISRVSFAPEEFMVPLGTVSGGSTVLSVLLETSKNINIVFDKEVLDSPTFVCTDGTANGFVKIKTDDLLNKILPYAKREYSVIEV